MTGPEGIPEQLTKRVYERILGAEMTHYLGYEKGKPPQGPEAQKPPQWDQ
jgi:putative transposase